MHSFRATAGEIFGQYFFAPMKTIVCKLLWKQGVGQKRCFYLFGDNLFYAVTVKDFIGGKKIEDGLIMTEMCFKRSRKTNIEGNKLLIKCV